MRKVSILLEGLAFTAATTSTAPAAASATPKALSFPSVAAATALLVGLTLVTRRFAPAGLARLTTVGLAPPGLTRLAAAMAWFATPEAAATSASLAL
jgi:hypothetical protein